MTAVLVGCAPNQVLTKRNANDALAEATRRLEDQDIGLIDEARRPDRIRSATYCYVGATSQGFSWNRNFAQRRMGPVPFRHVGDDAEHARIMAACPSLFRFEVRSSRQNEFTRLTVDSGWWRLERGECSPHGHRLVGQLDCVYHYRGSPPRAKIEAYVYAILKGL